MILRDLWREFGVRYRISLLAGEAGMDRAVYWVHSVEDADVAKFLHGNELIFVTGIAQSMPENLSLLVERLYGQGACGLVVNIGPYIHEVSAEIISFCEENAFPLFTVPWEIHLVDVIKAFMSRIHEEEFETLNLAQAMKNACLFSPQTNLYLPYMTRAGCSGQAGFRVGVVTVGESGAVSSDLLFYRNFLKTRPAVGGDQTVIFDDEEHLVFVYYGEAVEKCREALAALGQFSKENGLPFTAGLGSFTKEASGLSESYTRARKTARLAWKRGFSLLFYDDLGVYQVIMNCPDEAFLRDFAYERLGKLLEEDKEKGTENMKLLRDYIESGGGVAKMAERNFCHRNTISYQINKIKVLLGRDLEEMPERAELLFAFQILDCL